MTLPLGPIVWITFALVVLAVSMLRGRVFAVFASVLLSIHASVSLALLPDPHPFWAEVVFLALQLSVAANIAFLSKAKLRSAPFRWLVSWPAAVFVAGSFLAIPWGIAAAIGYPLPLPWLPYLFATWGWVESMVFLRPNETTELSVDGLAVEGLKRYRTKSPANGEALRVVQITDPHLGPFMSEKRLRKICEHAVQENPDLVLLTGDFLTMEGHHAKAELARAFEPLAALEGKVFACLGNHDYEAPETVKHGLDAAKAKLLVDDCVKVQTRLGPVQILGMSFSFRNRKANMAKVCAQFPREKGVLRLVLLHDPGAFPHLPENDADAVFSGHTHGGQLGLVTLGLSFSVLRILARHIPDHGPWALSKSRLYVHRGTGHYGFPLRLGVPAERSVIRIVNYAEWQGSAEGA